MSGQTFTVGLTNAAHKKAGELMEVGGVTYNGQQVIVLSFESLKDLIHNSMVDGAEIYRKKLTGQT